MSENVYAKKTHLIRLYKSMLPVAQREPSHFLMKRSMHAYVGSPYAQMGQWNQIKQGKCFYNDNNHPVQ